VSNVPVKEVRNDPFDESRVLFFSSVRTSSPLVSIIHMHRKTYIHIHASYTKHYIYRVQGDCFYPPKSSLFQSNRNLNFFDDLNLKSLKNDIIDIILIIFYYLFFKNKIHMLSYGMIYGTTVLIFNIIFLSEIFFWNTWFDV